MELHSEPTLGDAFGAALRAHLDQSPYDRHYVERSDGLIDDMPHSVYFTEPHEWPSVDQACLDRLHGRVLDIGAGAGRASLAAQELGHRVTALDISPGAVAICREQGVSEVYDGTVEDLQADGGGGFDTFLMLGNNIGLLGCRDQAPATLEILRSLGNEGCRIVGTAGHIYRTEDPKHLSYHELNRSLGRMAGCLRLRVRFRDLAGEWFDYLFASPEELAELASEAGWELTDVVDGDGHVESGDGWKRVRSFVYMVELTAR